MKNRGIAFKLSLIVLISVTLIFALVLSYNYVFSSRIIIKNIEKNAHNLTSATVNRIDKVLFSVEKIPRDLAGVIENAPYTNREDMIDLLFSVVGRNPEIHGVVIAFEPFAHDAPRERERKSVVEGKSVDLGGRRISKKKKIYHFFFSFSSFIIL